MMKSDGDHLMPPNEELAKHIDKWVVMSEGKVLVSGFNGAKALKEFREKYPDKTPFVTKIPKEYTMLL